MIWSERRNFCFIHIPKTGGSAISFGYAKVMNLGDVLLGGPQFAEKLQQIYRPRFGVHKHSYASKVAAVVGQERFQRSFSFAVIRDPMARLVSYYRWLQKASLQGALNEDRKRLRQCATFREFAEEASQSFEPQSEYVQDSSGATIVSELVMYERLAEEWPRISAQIGVSIMLPIKNKSPSLPVEIDAAVEKIVGESYRSDYELLERMRASP